MARDLLNRARRLGPLALGIAAGLLLARALDPGAGVHLRVSYVAAGDGGGMACSCHSAPGGNLVPPHRTPAAGAWTLLVLLGAAWAHGTRRRPAGERIACLATFLAGAAGSAAAYNYSTDGSGNPVVWAAADLPIPYRIHQAGTADIDEGAADEFAKVQEAFAAWDAVTDSTIAFSYGGTTTNLAGAFDGTNTVSWAESGWTFGSSVLGITYTWFSGSRLLEADVVLNGETASWTAAQVKGIMLHEAGHFLGLQHSASSTAVMWPTYTGLMALGTDDLQGVRFLYPAAADATAPGAVTDLTAASGTWDGEVSLQWTAPGDDGATGTAASYRVRYATSAISSEGGFTAATAATAPAPVAAGGTQICTVSGLVPGTTYYFSVRALDEASNQAALSNSPSAAARTGAGADASAPAAVTDLAGATGDSGGTLVVSWTAPGDDAGTGTATSYNLRYAGAPIATDAAFAAASAITGLAAPRAAGTSESVTLTGSAGTTYYFALKTVDERGNTSALSNSASATAFGPPTTLTATSGGGGGSSGCFLSPP